MKTLHIPLRLNDNEILLPYFVGEGVGEGIEFCAAQTQRVFKLDGRRKKITLHLAKKRQHRKGEVSVKLRVGVVPQVIVNNGMPKQILWATYERLSSLPGIKNGNTIYAWVD